MGMIYYKRGSTGAVVKQIQEALHLLADGIYGAITEDAVKVFQRENGLTVDGIVGPATLAKLIPQRLKKSERKITEIIIHCSATPDGKDYTVDDLRRWHKQQGYADVGYHYIVYRNGILAQGRDVNIIGAHASGHNAHSIGICYIGGMNAENTQPEDTRTLRQKARLLSLLVDLRKLYPNARIIGHRDLSEDKNGNGIIEPSEWMKACPSFDAKSEYHRI
jgi:N-acetyl-anhydromuramyl-L-alanine amidase AmpD